MSLQRGADPATGRDSKDSHTRVSSDRTHILVFRRKCGGAEQRKRGVLRSGWGPGTTGVVYEVTQDGNAQTVWRMETGQYAYRGQRIPSLYPGVQW